MMAAAKRMVEAGLVGALRHAPSRLMAHLCFLLRSHPEIADAWGYHVRAINYYEPLPDFRALTPERLSRKRLSPAIDFRPDRQRALALRLADTYASEIATIAALPAADGFDFANPYFSGFDAAAFYALIRDLKPRSVIEIGAGFSTRIAAKALARNGAEGKPGRLVCIEPFPEPRLTQSGAAFELVRKSVQDVPLEVFDQLDRNDILFIDSSHVATAGSDVCMEFLEILPRLKPGVWVHVHDIFFPADYPAEWLIGRRIAFNEQYMLEAFLAFNSAYAPQLANAWLWSEERDLAQRLLGGGATAAQPPASFWMQRT